MSDLILLGKRVWFGLCALVFLGLTVQWLSLGANEVDETLPPAAPVFADAIDIVAARQKIAAHNLWEPARKPVAVEDSAQPGSEEAAVEKTLYLAALLQRGAERSALLGVVGEPDTVKRYTEGEILPNGGQLLKIHADHIEYSLLASVVDAEQVEAQNEQEKNQTDIKILYLFGRSGNINE